ncbi:MAG: NlpC/P60 family protein [Micropepsaceae bacterium]
MSGGTPPGPSLRSGPPSPEGEGCIAEARGWIGTPFVHRASVKGAGADCLGLVRGVWRAVRGAEPERAPVYAPLWAEESGAELLLEALGRHLRRVDEALPGDVLAFRVRTNGAVKHAGVMTGADGFVHAHERLGVVETPFSEWWRRRLAAAFRF